MLDAIARYTKLFWIHTGPFNNLTARKFVLDLRAGGVRGAVQRGGRRRRALPLEAGEIVDALLARLPPVALRHALSSRW